MSDERTCKVRFAGGEIEVPVGRNLRKALLKAGLSPHNGQAVWLNCKGFGTCGTCAVAIEGAVSPHTRRERWRLGFPPHNRDAGLRLACQCRVEGDVVITKFGGFWGQKTEGPPER
jgi:ferredoxin